jgi:RNA polymerase sigma-70 factor, ECF subfamily
MDTAAAWLSCRDPDGSGHDRSHGGSADILAGVSGLSDLPRMLSQAWDRAPGAPVEPDLGAQLEAARNTWSGVGLSREAFLAHLAARVAERDPPDPLAYVASLHLSDLYLACGCLQGDPVALRGIEPLFASVPAMVRALAAGDAFADEVRARVSERLLVAGPGRTPKLARYGGEGSLRSWFTVVVNREALLLKKAEGRMQPAGSGQDVAGLLAGRFEPELELLRARFAPEIEAAMRDAVGRLPARERLLLRLSMVEGVTMGQIAGSYRVNQSTVSRWIARALDTLHQAVRHSLRQRCGLGSTELESLMAALRSRVEVSVGNLLVATLSAEPGMKGEP